jgi:hypothetical protein
VVFQRLFHQRRRNLPRRVRQRDARVLAGLHHIADGDALHVALLHGAQQRRHQLVFFPHELAHFIPALLRVSAQLPVQRAELLQRHQLVLRHTLAHEFVQGKKKKM